MTMILKVKALCNNIYNGQRIKNKILKLKALLHSEKYTNFL